MPAAKELSFPPRFFSPPLAGAGAAAAMSSAMAAAAMAPMPSNFQYLVQDYLTDVSADDAQNALNMLGAEGWQLLFVNQIDDKLRAWFIKGGAAPPLPAKEPPPLPAEESTDEVKND